MSKRMFPAGTIVRKKAINIGIPIGPYMRVDMANAHYVYATPIDSKDSTLLQRDCVHKPTIIRLCVSKIAIQNILHYGAPSITHKECKQWLKCVDDSPEIVEFYTSDGWYKIWCTLAYASQYISAGQKRVRIVIDRVIDRKPKL